jgi:UDP-glucose 4-epimerase
MATYLVTGGAGFIGSHLVDALLARGHSVRVLDDLSSGKLENLPAALLGRPGSGAAVELCLGACSGVSGVFHEAAQVSVPRSVEDPRTSYAINVTGTLNLLEGARACGVARFVFAASSAAYGDSELLPKVETMTPSPLSPYASGKVAGEHLLQVYAHVYGMRTVALRYFNVFGPRQADDSPYTGVIALFAKALLEGRRARIFGDGQQTRDFTFVENVVEANLQAMEREVPPGAVINVGTGQRVSIHELYSRMAQLLGRDIEPVFEPARVGDVRHSLAAIDRARLMLDYAPRKTWEQGLESTVDWYRSRAHFTVAT